MKPKITLRDDPLPPLRVLDRVEDDPYQCDHPGFARIFCRQYGDGSRELFFGDHLIRYVRRNEHLSTPKIPYVTLVADDGSTFPFGQISVSEHYWLLASIRGPWQ